MKLRVANTILSSLLALGSLSASNEFAGFQRVTGLPADDLFTWDNPNRFQNINFEAFVAETGAITSASGSTITSNGNLWSVDEFKYIDGVQPRHFVLEITSGTEVGSKFNVTSNLGNSLTLDLNGGSLASVLPGDTFQVVAKWSLNQLFPNGNGITPSTDSVKGSEVLIPDAVPGGVDFSSSPTFQYRSDLQRWVDVSDDTADIGDLPFESGTQVVIRQSSLTPLQPLVAGFSSNGSPLSLTVSYLQEGLDSFSNALSISGGGARAANALGASGEFGEPQHAGNTTTASVWFQYTASESGTLIVRSEHSNFDTILAAYSGTSLATLSELAANDDVSLDTWSEISIPISNGESYYIALDGKAGATGEAFISWEVQPGTPEITVEYPNGISLTDGNSTINLGNIETTTTDEVTITITNSGNALLSALTATLIGTDEDDFSTSDPALTTLASGQSTTLTLRFLPNRIGSHSAMLQIASNDPDENPFEIALSASGIPVITMTSWGTEQGLSGNGLLSTADEDDDTIPLIHEYAFNLDPTRNGLQAVEPESGVSGLPSIRAEGERLVVEFIRRTSRAEMTAKAVFGNTLTGEFTESTEPESVTPIDDYYERVVIADSVTTATASHRFAKVVIEPKSP